MSQKKKRPRGEQPRHTSRKRPTGNIPDLPEMSDRRAMEKSLQELLRGLSGKQRAETPLEKAQELMYQAFKERDPRRRVKLANDALALSPDCADAYVVLAEEAPTRKQRLELCEKGVAAGERALGPDFFQQHTGHFWGILETRPYMRARHELANSLWAACRRDEAIQHLQDMLRLNPGDNQGLRYILASFLLFLDRDDDLERLLVQFAEDGMADFAYTRALLAFRKHGDTKESRESLQAALKTNRHVSEILLGLKPPQAGQPSYFSPGDENEAMTYLRGNMANWKDTPGAISWLRGIVQPRKKKPDQPQGKGPLRFIKKWLLEHLPLENDTWQAASMELPNWLRIGGETVRPWAILVVNPGQHLILAHELLEEPPTTALLWDTLVAAMQHPLAGQPHRPATVQIRPSEQWVSLRAHLEEIGVQLAESADLAEFDEAFGGMAEHLCGKTLPGLLDVPGVTPEKAGNFFEAAAAFFRQSPWKMVGYESAIKVECDGIKGGPWYGVLMGLSGVVAGLAMYTDLKLLRRVWANDPTVDPSSTVAMSVTFGEDFETPLADVLAAKAHGWEVARSDAYPTILHKSRSKAARGPVAWEIELMEACLRAVPEFVKRHRQDDPSPDQFTVGLLKLTLTWTQEEE